KIYEDSKGYIWVATSGYGVFVIDPTNDKILLTLPAIDKDGNYTSFLHVHHVMEYNDTTMIMSGGTSLHVFNRITKNIRTIGNENTIAGAVMSVEKDNESGYVWLS